MTRSKRQSVFNENGIHRLEYDYIPLRLPHRENQIRKLVDFFRLVIDQPGVLSERMLITGFSGTGKTASAMKTGTLLKQLAKKSGLDLIYVHVNCRTTSSKFGLVQSIIRHAAPSLPLRGYSAVELLHALWDYLNQHNKFLVLTLDEVDYYIRTTGDDIVYELTRLTDDIKGVPQRINFIFIARDHSFLKIMSKETLSTFRPQERIEFPPYLENQIRDILRNRVDEAFKQNVVSEELVDFIANCAVEFGEGDARYAILILLSSGRIADREMSSTVMPEHVREAQEHVDPQIRDEDIILLSKNEKYLLLALAKCLKSKEAAVYISFDDVETSYNSVCEEFSTQPVGRVLLHRLVRDLNAAGMITLNDKFKLGLTGVKVDSLEKFLEAILKGKKPYDETW